MSSSSQIKTKLIRRIAKQPIDNNADNLGVLPAMAQQAQERLAVGINKAFSNKAIGKKLAQSDDEVVWLTTSESGMPATAISGSMAASGEWAPLAYVQLTGVTSDATGSSGTATDLAAPAETGAVSSDGSVEMDAGLSSAQMVAFGVLGLAGVGGIVAISVHNNSSNSAKDTSPPQLQQIVAKDNTITLTYSEALDPNHPPSASAFIVTTDGVANAVTAVTISGNTVVLSVANTIASGATISLAYSDPTTGDDVNAIQDQAGNDANGFVKGVVADGYIRGAKIYIDVNGDGIAQESEFTGVTTDANGTFILPNSHPLGAIIAVGGTNIDTGLPQLTPLKAPAGSLAINPLTTLLHSFIDKNPGATVSSASSAIAASLGIIIPEGLDLSTFNPLASANPNYLAAQKVAAQIATLVNLTASTDSTTAGNVITGLVNQINPGSVLDLSNSTTLSTVIGSSADSSILLRISQANLTIKNALNFSEITTTQKSVGDTEAPGTPSIVDLADSVSDGLHSIRIILNGASAKTGDFLELSDQTSHQDLTDIELSDADIARGYVDVTLNLGSLQNTGSTYLIAGRIVDASMLPGPVSTVLSFLNAESPFVTHNATSLSANANFDYNEALTASQFANAAYDHRTKNAIDTFIARSGWQKIGDSTASTELEVSNAYSFAAKHVSTNGSVDYVISFEGSNSPFDSVQIKDWTVANASEYGWSKYYASLMPLMKDVLASALADKRAGKDVEISLTGHSLGGAAACVAYADLFLPTGTGVWLESGAPLGTGKRIYDLLAADSSVQALMSGQTQTIQQLLLPSIDTYVYGAPSFLIEPTKFNNPEWASLGLSTVRAALESGGMAAALNFLEASVGVISVDPLLLPDLTNYWQHVFQFEHKNSSVFAWNDPVADLGTYDAGTVISLDLATAMYQQYKGSWYNPIALHSIDYYGESIARLMEADVLTKTNGYQLLTSIGASTTGNDFILNAVVSNGDAGNDDFVFNSAGTYTVRGDSGDDAYMVSAYGVDLTIDGSGTDGSDVVYFALPGLISASAIDTDSSGSPDAVNFTITNGTSTASVLVKNWSNHYVDQVAQIVETTDPWQINYFNMNNIVESSGLLSVKPTQQLNGLTYNTDGYGQPFVMAVPNGNDLGSMFLLPTPIIANVAGSVSFMVNGDFDPSKPTYVYTHGWTDNARVDATGSIKAKLIYDAYVTKYGTGSGKTANIVMANWESLAASTRDPSEKTSEPTYESSITKQVGEVIADALIRAGADINRTTLIGHSLGSFVVGSAANEVVLRTGIKVKELVALDTAATNPLFPEYDIDARNGYDRSLIFGSGDAPYDFTDAIAQHTTSYTVIDNTLTGGLSGNNDRASTADSAYLVAYVPTDVAFLSMKATSPFHNGVVAAYADLVAKGDLNPTDVNSALATLKFNSDGEAVSNGVWDGVLAVNQPWLTSAQLNADGNYIYNPPKSIGWISNIDSPTIYGSSVNDVMFFDEFKTDSRIGATLNGGAGNDWLGGSTGQGVDHLIGGTGQDTFFFGFIKNTNTVLPYLDGASWWTDNGTDAFGIIDDFSLSEHDQLDFGWDRSSMTLTNGADFSTKSILGSKLSSLYGNGVAFSVNNDLIAYVKNITVDQVNAEIGAGDIAFSIYANLDQSMFFTTPASVTMPTPVPVVI